jgi:transaldolase
VQLFIDSANIDEIAAACRWGVISGVTTNPSLMARAGQDMTAAATEIVRFVDGPVSLEVLGDTAADMIQEGVKYAAIHPRVNVKIPVTPEGLQAIRQLRERGVATNATLVFSANQALLAARAGAAFVSPFIGRIDDTGQSGLQVLQEIVDIFQRHNLESRIIAASVRNARQVSEFARIGSHIATLPFAILEQMARHPLTEAGIETFKRDWARRASPRRA